MEENQIQHLINQCRKNDRLAQHRLFNQYVKAMYNTALRLIQNEHDAHDVVQEGFIKAFTKIDQYKSEASFGAWLKRIVVNTALDKLKQTSPEFTNLQVVIENNQAEEVEISGFPKAELVNQEILKLPEGCRVVFTLYQLEGYAQSEIAQKLGVSLSTVKTQYRRARLLLKERLMLLKNEGQF